MANLKPILDSTKIALEKEASDRFGAAVEDFSRGTLGPLLGVPDPSKTPVNRNDGSFYASSYAAALAGANSYRPKLKFLFKVEFIFTDEAMNLMPTPLGLESNNDFTFLVKSVDRPKIDFEYEDDINMYNFRTKVLKKIRHRELTITFMDDTGNRVLNFFRALMMIYSPITRRQIAREKLPLPQRLDAPPVEATAGVLGSGMQFSRDKNDISHRGFVSTNVGSLIHSIRVKQVYVDPGEKLGLSTQEVIFDFLNARLVSFDLDDLNHETSDVSLMTMQFDYDWMEVITTGPLQTMDGPHYRNIATPGINGAPVDMTTVGASGVLSPGNGSQFLNIITNQLGRGAQQLTSEAVTRGVQAIAGKGRFASLIGSQASNILGGVVGASARGLSTVGGTSLASTVNQALARPIGVTVNSIRTATSSAGESNTRVIDSAEGGPTGVIGTTTSTEPYISDTGA